jgi:hypothetical protein
MEWPPQSPDLNLIENLLDGLESALSQALFEVIQLSLEEFGSSLSIWQGFTRSIVLTRNGFG